MLTPDTAGECCGDGGGGGGGSIDVQQDGVDVVNPATVLNFTGDGVTVTQTSPNVAEINIPGAVGEAVQTGRYVADGTEDPNGFPIVFADLVNDPITVLSTDYNAWATGGGLTLGVQAFDCPIADFTTIGLTVIPTATLEAGDVIIIAVSEKGAGGGGGGGGGGGSPLTVTNDDDVTVTDVTTLSAIGTGVVVTEVAAGHAQLEINDPNLTSVIADTDFSPGSLIYVPSSGHGDLADAKDPDHSIVLGFSIAAVSQDAQALVRTGGQITLTSLQWQGVNETGDPLVPGALYYASENALGFISITKPVLNDSWIAPVLYAVTDEIAIVRIQLVTGPIVV